MKNMKRIFKGMVLVIMVVLVLGSLAYARGGGSRYGMNLTGKTIDISGTIQAVDFTPPHYGMNLTGKTIDISGTIQAVDFTPTQIEIKVDVNGKIVEVELGPVNQYDSKDFQIGSAVSLNGEYVEDDVFIPYSLKVNDTTYKLRDADGYPLWAGKGNSRGMMGHRSRNR